MRQFESSKEKKESSFGFKECAFSMALAIGLVTGVPQFCWAAHASPGPVLPDLAVLISGPPIKDPGALLRYALPIDNKAIREVQKPLDDITDSLKISGVKALDSVERLMALLYKLVIPRALQRVSSIQVQKKNRTIPLEIMVVGDKTPVYGETLEDLGRYKAQTRLPSNAFGTMAMARDEFEPNSASSQVFWLLKESELTPSNANILDGRYAVFGYVTENEDYLADLKVGDVNESAQVVSGLENLVNLSYKISG